eukprot:766619-Hanusia_phi.AAC.1
MTLKKHVRGGGEEEEEEEEESYPFSATLYREVPLLGGRRERGCEGKVRELRTRLKQGGEQRDLGRSSNGRRRMWK